MINRINKPDFWISVILVLLVSLTSCMDDLKTDELIQPIPMPEGIKVGSVELGSNYINQVYYSLESNSIVKVNTNYTYDLAFESTTEGWHILLNSARFMYAGNTGSKNFDSVTSQAGAVMNFDNSNGSLDSTAIGNWVRFSGNDTISEGWVYVIDQGLNLEGNPMGYRKVIFGDLSEGKYKIRFSNLDGTGESTFEVPKNSSANFVGFSFENGGALIDIEPFKTDFDLFIGQYTTLLYSGTDPYPYLVRGVLLNRYMTSALEYDGERSFEDIDFEEVSQKQFSPDIDVIGHEWKYYNLEEGFYKVDPEKIFIIRNQHGIFYKLHFISFYNNNGEVGYPKFEFMRLN